jgi:hypothetical protein
MSALEVIMFNCDPYHSTSTLKVIILFIVLKMNYLPHTKLTTYL